MTDNIPDVARTWWPVEIIVHAIRRGDMRVDAFDLRWGVQDVIALLDSVVKGYPIGWLVFASLRDSTYYLRVVDGHHRLTVLEQALTSDAWGIGYDIDRRAFVQCKAKAVPTIRRNDQGGPSPPREPDGVRVAYRTRPPAKEDRGAADHPDRRLSVSVRRRDDDTDDPVRADPCQLAADFEVTILALL